MDKHANNSRSKKMKLGIFGGIILLLVIGFAIPLLMTDGTERFTGKEKEAAQGVLDSVPGLTNDPSDFFGAVLKNRVEAVRPSTPEEAKGWCGLSDSANTNGYYSVTISQRTLFGIVSEQFTRHDACIHMR